MPYRKGYKGKKKYKRRKKFRRRKKTRGKTNVKFINKLIDKKLNKNLEWKHILAGQVSGYNLPWTFEPTVMESAALVNGGNVVQQLHNMYGQLYRLSLKTQRGTAVH